ncbi:hypothetical protein [Cohnella sp. WQ 127256]|uniref:hypothetical protein n=1 Tax=Cohnella sp. WQ 127256 TaxID=2938790 RepID=UPI0021180E61|nr:hypothetical protein [Cohnella sp. WQ 127256]
MADINTLTGFFEVFRLPIIMSLIGGLIGHFVKNGIVELPKIVIEYDEEHIVLSRNRLLSWLQRIYHFIIFILGYRQKSNETKRVFFDLGFLGDLLIAIGTGIVAKTALGLAETDNDFAVISSSLLAGFAGLSYLKGKANEELSKTVPEEVIGSDDSTPQ